MVSSLPLYSEVMVQEQGENANIIFLYINDDAQYVGLVGDFQNWDFDSPIPMNKNSDGMWTYTLTTGKSDFLLYKFVVDGVWMDDPDAIETRDDGFGGRNAFIDVERALIENRQSERDDKVFSMFMPTRKDRDFRFGIYSSIWFTSMYQTEGIYDLTAKGYDLNNVDINARLSAMIEGWVLDWLFVDLELALFEDGRIRLYETGAADSPVITWEQGFETYLSSFFNPFVAYNNNEYPALGQISADLILPYLGVSFHNYKALGYGHHEYTWRSVYDQQQANQGILEIYSTNTSGTKLSAWDKGALETTWLLATTKRNGPYGLYGWADFELFDTQKFGIEVNYQSAYDESNEFFSSFNLGDSANIEDITTGSRSLIYTSLGYAGYIDVYRLSGQVGLTAGATQENADQNFLLSNLALAVGAERSFFSDMLSLFVGIRSVGTSLDSIYGREAGGAESAFGDDKNALSVLVYPSLRLLNSDLRLGLDTSLRMTGLTSQDTSELYGLEVKPTVRYRIKSIYPMFVDTYFVYSLDFYTANSAVPHPIMPAFTTTSVDQIGFRYRVLDLKNILREIKIVAGLELNYVPTRNEQGLVADYLLSYYWAFLATEFKFMHDIVASVGIDSYNLDRVNSLGLTYSASERSESNVFGLALGLEKKFFTPMINSPTFFVKFDYNFSPYDDSDSSKFDFDDSSEQETYFMNSLGINDGDGTSSFSLGMRWDY